MTSIKPSIFQALVIAKALELYERTGIKANRAYTPKNMMNAARQITGREFAARDYLGAAKALQEFAARERLLEITVGQSCTQ